MGVIVIKWAILLILIFTVFSPSDQSDGFCLLVLVRLRHPPLFGLLLEITNRIWKANVHFNWTELIPGVDHHSVHIATAIGASSIMIIMALSARLALGNSDAAITPSDRFSLKGVFEVITEFITNLTVTVVGEHGRHFAPMFCKYFLFVLFNNFVGLLPGMTPATDNINTNLAAGAFVF